MKQIFLISIVGLLTLLSCSIGFEKMAEYKRKKIQEHREGIEL